MRFAAKVKNVPIVVPVGLAGDIEGTAIFHEGGRGRDGRKEGRVWPAVTSVMIEVGYATRALVVGKSKKMRDFNAGSSLF